MSDFRHIIRGFKVNKNQKPLMERVRECRELIEGGMSLRKACKKADVDDKTYKRNVLLLDDSKREQGDIMESIANDKIFKDITPTPVNVPVTSHVKRKQILIRIPIDVYDYIQGEAEKTGNIIKPSTIAADKLTRLVREEIRSKKQ